MVLGRTLRRRTDVPCRQRWLQTPVLRFGSRSSELHIRPGEVLPARTATIPTRHPSEPTWRSATSEPFRIIEGPDGRGHPELDSPFWDGRRFDVGSQNDRMGLRLAGEPLLFPDRAATPLESSRAAPSRLPAAN